MFRKLYMYRTLVSLHCPTTPPPPPEYKGTHVHVLQLCILVSSTCTCIMYECHHVCVYVHTGKKYKVKVYPGVHMCYTVYTDLSLLNDFFYI